MRIGRFPLALPILAALLVSGPAAGFAQKADEEGGPAERLGRQLDEVLREVRRDFRDLSEDVQERFARARTQVDAMGVEARIYGRLHWDKALENAKIAVDVREDKTAVLTGWVHDAAARALAERLTGDTVGVAAVENHLEIKPEPAPAEQPAP